MKYEDAIAGELCEIHMLIDSVDTPEERREERT
jgi:hypothetical protein